MKKGIYFFLIAIGIIFNVMGEVFADSQSDNTPNTTIPQKPVIPNSAPQEIIIDKKSNKTIIVDNKKSNIQAKKVTNKEAKKPSKSYFKIFGLVGAVVLVILLGILYRKKNKK